MKPFAFIRVAGHAEEIGLYRDGHVTLPGEAWPDAPTDIASLMDGWDQHVERAAEVLSNADLTWVPEAEAEFVSPVRSSATVYCCGANYFDHIAEMGTAGVAIAESKRPFHFVTPKGALQGHRKPVVRPKDVERLDWEVELAVVIARDCFQVAEDEALDFVGAYTVANDVSSRDPHLMFVPPFGLDWQWAKGQLTLLPIGPGLVPSRFVPDPGQLGLRLWVDDVLRQDSSTSNMIHSIAKQISILSEMTPLRPGDVILTGTPAGTAAAHGMHLADGARMVAEIDGVGRLENHVVPTSEAAEIAKAMPR